MLVRFLRRIVGLAQGNSRDPRRVGDTAKTQQPLSLNGLAGITSVSTIWLIQVDVAAVDRRMEDGSNQTKPPTRQTMTNQNKRCRNKPQLRDLRENKRIGDHKVIVVWSATRDINTNLLSYTNEAKSTNDRKSYLALYDRLTCWKCHRKVLNVFTRWQQTHANIIYYIIE